MLKYVEYFTQGSNQALSLFAVAIIWLSMTSVGAWISGKERVIAADIVSGWALMIIILTFGGIFSDLSLTVFFYICATVVILSFIFVVKREGLWLTTPFLKLILLATPLLLIASAIQGSQWDEFSTWLEIPRYLYTSDHLPSAENAYPAANMIAYPFSWHFINYLASTVAGKFLENIGPLFNILLLFAFSLGILNVIDHILGGDHRLKKQSWSIIALVGLATTLFNPTFAQKVVLTSYADTSTAVVTGFAVVLAWFTLEGLSEGNKKGTRNCALQLSMTLVILVSLKQATFAIFGLIILGFLLVAYRDRSIAFFAAIKVILVVILPALLMYIAWRHYVSSELAGGEMVLKPFARWHIQHIPSILLQMLVTLLKKGYYFLLALILVALSIRAFWKCEHPADRLFLLSGFVILGYNSFLFFIYVSSFGEADAIRVASYWRYNMHMGAVIIAGSGIWLVTFWRRFDFKNQNWIKVSWVPIILLITAPFIFAKKLRFDLDPMIQHYRSVGRELPRLIMADTGYKVLDPNGTGESYNITTYEMKDWAKPYHYLAAFHPIDSQVLESVRSNKNLTYLVLYSVSPIIKSAFTAELNNTETYLLRRSKNTWTIVASWPRPNMKR